MFRRLIFCLCVTTILLNCTKRDNDKKPVPTTISDNSNLQNELLKLRIIRVEKEFFESKNRNQIKNIFDKYPQFAEKFLKRSQYPNDSIIVNAFYQLSVNESIDSIYRICNEVFGDFYNEALQFQNAFQELAKYDKQFRFPVIYTIITGMGNDMLVNDSMIVVGLEFFLAEKSRYKPQLPLYMLKRYRNEYIVPMAISVISSKYNSTDYLDNSLLAEMIYFGKSYYFVEKLIPSLNDTIIAGYENTVLDDVKRNQQLIWAHFIEKKLLFETKNEVTNRYVGERPVTFEIGNNCPGRIGRWLGWQIVRAYANRNPNLSLMDIMKEKDAKKILSQSRYKPEN